MTLLNEFLDAVPNAGALGRHVWQSTLFVGLCWFAAVLFKHRSASLRYSLWLAASVKFLVPFSVLVGLGTYAVEFTNIRVVPENWTSNSNVAPQVKVVDPS